jgi:hypothetical protein
MVELKEEGNRKKLADFMAKGYNIPAADALGMLGDAHSTNWKENYQFFLNQNNPTNFERVWKKAYDLYGRVGSITHQPVGFDQVMDFRVIEKLGKEAKYKSTRGVSRPEDAAHGGILWARDAKQLRERLSATTTRSYAGHFTEHANRGEPVITVKRPFPL